VHLSRRNLLRVGATGLAAAAVAGVTSTTPAHARIKSVATLTERLVPGPPGARGYRPVVRTAGEAHLLRTDLGVVGDRRTARRRGLSAFVQLSDVHVIDAQSPLRVEWTDRLDDPTTLPGTGIFTSAYRPQEMLCGHIAASMVDRINQIGSGPVTGLPLTHAVQTGDNSDNAQYNEIRWNIDLLGGGQVRFDSGNPNRWEGVHDSHATSYDPAYWHPDGAPLGRPVDRPRREHGFPLVRGLLDAVRRPLQSDGLSMDWYTVFGNHDTLVQGNFPTTLPLNGFATGNLKIISPVGLHPGDLLDRLLADPTGLLSLLALNPGVRLVTPDPDRRLLSRAEVVEEHFVTSGRPVGHGFTDTNRTEGTAYYSFDRDGIRFVVLDTVNPNGYADGSLDQTQFAWLADLLQRSAGHIVIVASHHTVDTMNNPFVATGGDLSPRMMGGEVLDLLLAHPEVVAWINGHTHRNRILPRPAPSGGGLWEITTASHIDWPQQSRLLEVTDNRDGTLSIFTTMVDHADTVDFAGNLDDPAQLAGLGRELSLNDWHTKSDATGAPGDRNVELVVADPR
jgi:metallophosphoesterase (TIGR03767 family)